MRSATSPTLPPHKVRLQPPKQSHELLRARRAAQHHLLRLGIAPLGLLGLDTPDGSANTPRAKNRAPGNAPLPQPPLTHPAFTSDLAIP